MNIDDLEPFSGTLLFIDGYESLEPSYKDNHALTLLMGSIRCASMHILLPIFSRIALIWNLFLGFIKIPIHLFLRKYQTEAFGNQIQGHFRCALLDALSTQVSHVSNVNKLIPSIGSLDSLHYFWVLGFTFFKSDVLSFSKEIKRILYPINPTFPKNPRLN